jgi:predicted transposase YbfD/YdcC
MDNTTKTVSLFLSFAREVDDFRTGNRLIYPSSSIVFMAFIGILCNAQDWDDVVEISEASEDLLLEYLGDEYVGIPSHDTFSRFFALVNPLSLEQAFRKVISSVRHREDGKLESIAIDGKYLCGVTDVDALNVVSAYSTERGLCLGQEVADKKMNEPEMLRKLVCALNIEGSVITADALHCQKESVKQIIEQKGDYLISVKSNQKHLYEGILEGVRVENIRDKRRFIDHAEESVTGHGRHERRVCHSCAHSGWLPGCGEEWEGIKSFGTVTSYRTVLATGESSSETRCFISSLPMNALEQMRILREHWKIENNLHWQLDVTYGEDLTKMNKNQLLNISLLRKLTMPILREFPYKKGASLKRKMFAASLKPKVKSQLIQFAVHFYDKS